MAPRDPSPAQPRRAFHDAASGSTLVSVAPGGHYVTSDSNEIVVTLLGSCVAACARDTVSGVGGLNHFLLPTGDVHDRAQGSDEAMRFGDYAMETLLNSIYRKGGQRGRIEFKIFGGARVLGGSSLLKIGEQNIAFVEKFLRTEGFPIVSRSVGGTAPRRLRFHPATGKAFVQELDRTTAANVTHEEETYSSRLRRRAPAGEVEFF
ncbi:chemoreceptor glutamine deamidase CheD [Alsobacter sp. SYSU M60028]|uniref:Probable chemoreceptor glutamine deamidase CheD n=1 Tax=Alsobacter ponti TaxID=2962936 RepID=A0ABT1L9Q2_9HYPH|nr:chemoreceptor glutamine deamidase CheD [Alsobacter ponti]MCP8937826.1 chemoreceptor glutamine deamidase CheD [Alsobacter ponti]